MAFRILILGNLGYVGPVVVRHLRAVWPDAELIGFDTAYFAHCLTSPDVLPERVLDVQYFGDIRQFPIKMFNGVESVINLAAISNDPMGSQFETATMAINHTAGVSLACAAKRAGVKSFVFASSCSVYGCAENGPRNESSPVDPLTAYARSKVASENDLCEIASESFFVTSLRFATACGWSDRLRLDLVLNDFVASAVATKAITILSDGTPWRPLIHVTDMARAIEWAVRRHLSGGDPFLVINAGGDSWNFQVRDLALCVGRILGNVDISINTRAAPDRRSYRVSFEKFKQLAPNHQPQMTIDGAIAGLKNGLESVNFSDPNFRRSKFIRLNVLGTHLSKGSLSEELFWR